MGHTKTPKNKKELVKEKLRLRKKESKKNKHRARLIVRNLPFATTEENLREHFEKFGEIDEVKLLKKEDGKLLGCGFVQFKLVQKAAKARHHLNGKPFLNREIECDWALPKEKYKKKEVSEQQKVEPIDIKEEPIDDSYNAVVKTENDEVKEEPNEKQNNADENSVKSDSNSEEFSENEDKQEESEDDKAEEDYDDDEIKEEDEESQPESKPHVVSNDAVEGRTVFIKNVPFTATNDDIKECMSQFGPLYYALICMDRMTEHSKGTAFVKFRNKEDADQCLTTPGITLMGNILEYQCALTKDELQKRSNEKKDRGPKDSRNLYLIKEGVVLAGSKAAEGVSAADMAKRLQIEQYKTQMLKNLNMFVARTRLIVHNIPASWDDSKLRKLFAKYSDPKAGIKEAKIMRNMRFSDGMGVGKSKEFGFVTFTAHEAALQALRAINNNPNIFTSNKRPIVAFSIENRAKLQTRERRLQNSKLKNPKCKSYNPNVIKVNNKNEEHKGTKRSFESSEEELKEFSGVAATPGNKKMRSKFNLRTQAQIHHEQLKKEKKNKKFVKKTLKEKQQEFTKQPKQKINKNKLKVSDNFSKLVNDYKKKLLQAPIVKKTKWYE